MSTTTRPAVDASDTPAPDTSVTGLFRCRHIDLLRVTSAACRRAHA